MWRGRPVACAACDATMKPDTARFCARCGVYLCPACSRKRRCPSKDPAHRPRVPLLRRAFAMGVIFAIVMLPVGGLVFAVDEGGRAYADMAVTPIASLAAGTTAKVFGTMNASSQVVIAWIAAADDGQWDAHAFNLTDGTGSVLVDMTRLDGTSSTTRIESGAHGRQWWRGDEASVVGDVRSDGRGGVYVLASRVARTPASFYRPEVVGYAVLFGTGGLALGVAAAGLASRRRMRRRHEERAPTYAHKWTDWRVCGNCGDRVALGEPHCPACGASSLREPVRNPPLDRLPSLALRTRFGGLPAGERVVAVVFALGIPAVLLGAAAGLALLPGYAAAWLPLVVVAVIFLVVAGPPFLKRTRILLSAETVTEPGLGWRRQVATREIDRALTVRSRGRTIHFVLNRGGRWVSFGPGLRPPDLEAATRWLQELASLAGIPHREVDSLPAAIVVLHRDD